MNHDLWTHQLTAPLAIAVGVLACFWGYRIVKVILGIMGFAGGFVGGWTAAASLAPGHDVIALVSALLGGVIGGVLCVWLYFLGIFLLGASAGVVVAGAVFAGMGHEAQPIFLVVSAVAFGLLALVLQKFMIIVSSAFSGSYLIAAGLLHLAHLGRDTAPLWFHGVQKGWAEVMVYVALVFWLVCGAVGARFQYRSGRKKVETTTQEAAAVKP
jgi:hypothetical protein